MERWFGVALLAAGIAALVVAIVDDYDNKQDQDDRLWISCEFYTPDDSFVHEIIVQDSAILVYENDGDRPLAIINDSCAAGAINETK